MNSEHSEKTDLWKYTGDGVQEEFIQVKLEPSQPCQGQWIPWRFPTDGHPLSQPRGAHPPLPVSSESPWLNQVLLLKSSLFSTLAPASTPPLPAHFTAR